MTEETGIEALLDRAGEFAVEIAQLLQDTVCDDPEIRADVGAKGRVVVSTPPGPDGNTVPLSLAVRGEPLLALRVHFRCSWDFANRYLAIDQSSFQLSMPSLGKEPLIRFDYVRDHSWCPAHIQLHAESAALGWLHSFVDRKKAPKVQQLHLPVGGKRFRPTLEDVIEFAVIELAVDAKESSQGAIEEGRKRWRRRQVSSVIRDVVKDDPDAAPDELHRAIDEAVADVHAASL